jgi:hypothetical protein
VTCTDTVFGTRNASTGLAGGRLPELDLALLLRAVSTSTTTPASVEATSTTAPLDAEPAPRSAEPAVHGAPADTEVTAAAAPRTRRRTQQRPVEPTKRAPSRRVATANAATATKASTATPAKAAKTAPTKTARTRSTSAKQVTKAGNGGGERAYRRMPDDFAAVYQQTPSASAIAEHYHVPRHTAQGWLGRIRATTVTPSPSGD